MIQRMMLLSMLMIISVTSYSQDTYVNSIHYKVCKGLEFNLKNLKDSVAFYSFAYEIKIRKVKDSTVVDQIRVNDSIANQAINNHEFLKRINFASLMGDRKELTLTIPVAMILRDYNSPKEVQPKISTYDFIERINKLFKVEGLSDSLDNFYFRPVIVYLSKRVCD